MLQARAGLGKFDFKTGEVTTSCGPTLELYDQRYLKALEGSAYAAGIRARR